MAKFMDVYKRPLTDGDVVLCSVGYTEGYTTSNIISNCTFIILGKEPIDMIHINDTIVCYKIEDPIIKQFAINFNYKEWQKRYKNAGFQYDTGDYVGSVYKDTMEMCGRTFQAGDFMIYSFAKNKAQYGIVISQTEILTDTGRIIKQKYGLLLTNLNSKEIEVKNKLVDMYKEIMKNRISTVILKNTKGLKSGEVYLSKDNKSICICVQDVGYTIKFKPMNITTTSPKYDNFVVQMPVSLEIAKKIQNKLNVGGSVSLYEIMHYISLRKYTKVYTPWDKGLVQRLIPYSNYIRCSEDCNNATDWFNYYDREYERAVYLANGSIIRQLYDCDGKVKLKNLKESKLKAGASLLGNVSLDKQILLLNDSYKEVIMNL